MFTSQDVAKLRAKTGTGMMDCKKALVASDGNMEKATIWLREQGVAMASKRANKIAGEGVVASYIHLGGKIGVLVEVNCETDFVAKSPQFNALVKDIAMQITASNPKFVSIEDVNTSDLEKEKEIFKRQAINEGKPEKIIDKMVDGRIKKYYQEVCLYEQPFVKEPNKSIKDIINEAITSIGEKISVRRFTRYQMGEGIEKRCDNLAEEVAKQIENK